MNIIDTLITNRTGGYYNATDLNRVGEAVQYLADTLNSYGYSVTVSAKTDWARGDIPRAAQMATYLANVTALKNRFYGATTLPTSMDSLTFAGANDIEESLSEINTNINNMLLSFWGCGEIGCGET